ncbi:MULTISPECIES: GlxA family transcriptional regulator [Pseudomonas]|uniref:GlxA family transcriptional regulator n=1 Tax=Pseudomonas TaxID=286 RepID=UPI0006CD3C97|nr:MULTISPECIES: GlxA family transcriptional regulator [Pseudomonas]KPA97046.1 transcriptional regulator, AraC family with amidase-like domain [Pseudomonas fuscovaginae]
MIYHQFIVDLSSLLLEQLIMHRIGFFVCHGHDALDLAGPLSAFNQVVTVAGQSPYELCVVSLTGGSVSGNTGLPIETAVYEGETFDTVVFVGGDIAPMRTVETVIAAKVLSANAARVASVCTGAFLLAETGLLDGRKATTHWRYAAQLRSNFPRIKVEADSIYIMDGHVWTSAGIASGIDLALGMIEKDMGADVARGVSRLLVVPYRRPGGQSQFSEMSQMDPQSDRIRIALNFARAHLAEPLPVERLADAARLSLRQFGRAFRRETGETPARAVERLRVEAARLRLQDGSEPIEQIALAVGFVDPERMRRAFIKIHGHPPQSIRRQRRDGLKEDAQPAPACVE